MLGLNSVAKNMMPRETVPHNLTTQNTVVRLITAQAHAVDQQLNLFRYQDSRSTRGKESKKFYLSYLEVFLSLYWTTAVGCTINIAFSIHTSAATDSLTSRIERDIKRDFKEFWMNPWTAQIIDPVHSPTKVLLVQFRSTEHKKWIMTYASRQIA